jgi:uncharacterized membrane protein AbrB (regulator of aidB expression)
VSVAIETQLERVALRHFSRVLVLVLVLVLVFALTKSTKMQKIKNANHNAIMMK